MATFISLIAARITTVPRIGLGMCIVRQHTDPILVTACMAAIGPAKEATGHMVAGAVRAVVVMVVTK
ncbi:hypothetical protein [Comamonas sp. 26]|uniref:hypothetical protein n=1 Tax=Comamonas sp. 26 TaxID=2035201 RepID=UPI00119825D3|nr:hypothetical protein [Comamonas sp. 26]